MFESWGRFPKVEQQVRPLNWRCDKLPPRGDKTFLCYGQGRSYGDSCLNENGLLLSTGGLARLISFDARSGILVCEAGVTLEQIIQFALPKGWFLPVSPGTKFVSVGGAIANDIHGKNHHSAGTFGRHVLELELLRSSGERIVCSLNENKDLFAATIAGMGLTGVILSASIQLKAVSGPYIDMESIKVDDLDEFLEVSEQSDRDFEYTVAWLDTTAEGKHNGRGLFMRGNHSDRAGALKPPSFIEKIAAVPVDFPAFALNTLSVKAFNFLYYHKQRSKVLRQEQYFDPFFYPLDAVHNWNRIYGKRGFFQFQCVVPKEEGQPALRKILKTVSRSGKASFLSVMKEFGDIRSPGIMSFPRRGVTLTLDFAHQGQATLDLMLQLDTIVRDAGGAQYPAKDACMPAESFQQYYPRWEEFAQHIDPKFSSSFWRRVTEGEKSV